MRTRSRHRRDRPQRAASRQRVPLPPRGDLLLLAGVVLVLDLIFAFTLELDPGLRLSLVPWPQWIARVLLIGLLAVGLAAYVWVRRPPWLGRQREKWFLAGLIAFNALVAQGLGVLSPYLIPVSLSVGLVVMFLGVEMGLVANLALAGLVALSAPQAGLALMLFAGAMIMVLRARRLERSRELILIGLEVGLVNLLGLVALALWADWANWYWYWQRFAAATVSGPVNALLLMGLVPLVEYMLQRTSPLGLIELLNTSHPLLERLQDRAPGTYSHSLSVARLASDAARAIGADALLTQVGALYHDIGKASESVSPDHFAENQRDGHNPHDHLSPNMSRLVLINHVKAGLEMGQNYGLKQDVLQFIAEHHGTTVMRFFYIKALKNPGEGKHLSLSDYRYEGQRPRSKETAILMLTDAVESISRTVDDPEQMAEVVDRVVQERLEDGQLDQCPLTLADLRKIKASFLGTLRSMMHSRPRYPDAKSDTKAG